MDQNDDIDLTDMGFDFDDYFLRHREGRMSEEEKKEWTARIIGLFSRDIIADRTPPEWVLNYLVEQFFKILSGDEWEHAFPLPWTTATPIYSRAEQQGLDIFCGIANRLKSTAGMKITEAIEDAAKENNVSFETARAAWYKHRKHLQPDFLKNDSKN